jgi:Domain of unknown function (DUF5916)
MPASRLTRCQPSRRVAHLAQYTMHVRNFLQVAITLVAVVVGGSSSAHADDGAHVVAAQRRRAAIHIDGTIDDAGWRGVPVAGDFWQRTPKEGAVPAHRTEFQIAYDDHAIYVAVRAFDDDPAHIRALLHRRDQESSADWIGVILDSYHDRRTGFGFALNAAGVQRDVLLYDDTNDDSSWDAVWSGASHIDDRGWTAEFRIPLGQLRFAEDDQPWGVQVMRYVGRSGEQDFWSPVPRNSPGFVSRFGELRGLLGLRGGRRIELLPYITGGLGRVPHDGADPFHDAIDPRFGLGLDAKVGLTSAITATATINPDFGQVEADPSQVNLTANETYFAEKRPFFVEGIEIFQFGIGQGDGDGSSDTLFYSRRIGAAPHGAIDGDYVDVPAGTTIYGAAKISGKTAGGWSAGLLDAITAQEDASAIDGNRVRSHAIVEPLTNYGLARVKKDLRAGQTTLGAALTSVTRALDGTGLASELHDQAITGGAALSHRFADDKWSTDIRTVGSWVHGTPEAIREDQLGFRHLYQRPDATHVELDPTRTSMSGGALVWDVSRGGGKHWRFAVGGDIRTPGFEANDLGFHGPVDSLTQWGFLAYVHDQPSARVLSWRINSNAWMYGNFAPEFLGYGGNLNGHIEFENFWNLSAGASIDNNMVDPGGTRGGPGLRNDPTGHVFANLSSDGRKPVTVEASGSLHRNWAADDFNGSVDVGANLQLRSNVEVFLGPSYATGTTHDQYVDEPIDGAGMSHYLFARIVSDTLALTVRGSWTFTPDVSLQFYAQPFVAAGAYSHFKQAAATRARAHDDRYRNYRADQLELRDGSYFIDDDRDGAADYEVGVPDFSVRELRATVVGRWQYRPGSAAFFIWSHGQSDATSEGDLRVGRDLAGIIRAASDDVVMLKVNYWFGL